MFLLSPDRYSEASPSLKALNFNTLFARSVLEHHVTGEVFVDNIENANAYYIVHPSGMSLLCGEVKDRFLQTDLKAYILQEDSVRKKDESLQVDPVALENRFDEVLGAAMCLCGADKAQNDKSYKVVKDKRVNFRFNQKKFERFLSGMGISQYTTVWVDRLLYQEITGTVTPNEFWDDAEKYTSLGAGFSLIYNQKPVATAFSSSIYDGALEIGIETQPEYRKHGFGSIVTARLILYCLEKGFEPVWSCRDGNLGSYNLALKMGFEPTLYLPYYDLLA